MIVQLGGAIASEHDIIIPLFDLGNESVECLAQTAFDLVTNNGLAHLFAHHEPYLGYGIAAG